MPRANKKNRFENTIIMNIGQYISHAVRFFLKLAVLVIVLYALLFVTGTSNISAESHLNELFHSWRGWGMILVLFIFSALYPTFGFVKRVVEADIVIDREKIVNALHATGYMMRDEVEGERMTFRADSLFRRITMVGDDKITVTASGPGQVTIAGIRSKAVPAEFRLKTFLENSRRYEDQ